MASAFLMMAAKTEDSYIRQVMLNIIKQKPDYQTFKVQENTENILVTNAGKVFFKHY